MTDEELRATMQDIYNRVCEHLVKQGKQALDPMSDEDDPTCMYRTPDGLMCAVGCLITEENYAPHIERASVESGEVRKALFKSGIPNKKKIRDLLWNLQCEHDKPNHGDFRYNLDLLQHQGLNHNLQIPQCLTDALK